MNRYGRGGSKAAATTLCQKCLKRGHYSYECKSATQERPYASRPSRTQQMLNPKLAPKLTNAAPAESLPKKAITDKEMEKSPDGRRRKQSLDDMDLRIPRKRSRSVSSRSSTSDSVATISTRSSRSPSAPQHARATADHGRSTPRRSDAKGSSYESGREKRRRRGSSASSSGGKDFEHPDSVGAERERNTRMRRGSKSPTERGRRRSRSALSDMRRKRSNSTRALDANDRSEGRAEGRRKESSEGYGTSGIRPDTYDHADREMKDAGLARQRSLSPYSKRLALSRDTNT